MVTASRDRCRIETGRITFVLAALGLGAGLLLNWTTSQYGIGVSPDSAHYIGAARSLVAGRGLEFDGLPFTHWPPLYPLLLAALSGSSSDPLQTARLLAIILFAVNTMLTAFLAYVQSAGSLVMALCAGALFVLSPEILHIHAMAWSEPPFLCLALLSLVLFRRWLALPTPLSLIALGICLSMALITRYVGVTLIVPFLVCILYRRQQPLRRRVAYALALVGMAVGPLAAWLLINRVVVHAVSDRPVVFHPPHGAAFVITGLVAFSAAALSRTLLREYIAPTEDERALFPIWIHAFLVAYGAFVFLSLCFLDALTPVDARILSPVVVFGGLLALHACWTAIAVRSPRHAHAQAGPQQPRRNVLAWSLASAVLIIACARGVQTLALANARHNAGAGYTARAWRDSPTLAWIDGLPAGAVIYSNAPELIAFHNRRTVQSLPSRFSPTSLLPNADLEQDVRQLQDAIRNGAVIVYFPGNPRSYLISSGDLDRLLPHAAIRRFADGAVYRVPPR